MSGDRPDVPLGLYIHLPWCVRKCPYCDFNSFERPDGGIPEERYVVALLADAARDFAWCAGRVVDTVFFGGGTPSLFSPEAIARLLAGLRERIGFAPDAEVTLEANPGTIEHGRFEGYRDAGINRVSLGAQSFAAAQLAALGRIHAAADTARAVGELEAAGLGNFNLDLMYALPGQSRSLAATDVDTAIALGAPHLSYYHLTLEPGTAYYRQPPPALPGEEDAGAIEADGLARMAAAGYVRYEISAVARPGHECRHNLNYWRFGDYVGIGAGAHGKLTLPGATRIVRTEKPRNPATYLRAALGDGALPEPVDVPRAARPFEFMLNALRLAEGYRVADYEARTGLSHGDLVPRLDDLAARGLVETGAQGVRPTPLGWRFLNDVQVAFLDS